MKQLCLAALFSLLLAGCASPAAREVFVLEHVPVAAPEEPAYEIFCQLPDACACFQNGGDRIAESNDGTFFLDSRVLEGMDAAAAMRAMTGLEPERLRPVVLSAMGMTDYRFSWWAETDTGLWLCRGRLLEDQNRCYALTAAMRQNAGDAAKAACDRALESFSLNTGPTG